jgi:gluconolactonase
MSDDSTRARLLRIAPALLWAAAACGCAAGGPWRSAPLPAGLVAADVKPASAASVAFLEGPAVDADGSVYFSDIAGNRILKLAPDGAVSVFRADSGRTNGNTFDAAGRLISCEGNEQGPGRRRIVRTDLKTGAVDVLTDNYQGKKYNAPNDVVVDSKGRIWFTDPFYGPNREVMEMPEAVYRIDPDGKVSRVLEAPQIGRPNGIAACPDGRTLYVVDSNYIAPDGNRKVWAFDVDDAGGLSNRREVFSFGTGRGGDGMRLDVNGNLWITAGISAPRTRNEDGSVPPGVYVVSPRGRLLGRIPIAEDVITNCAFGGPDGKTLYVTAGKTLYKVPVNVAGYAVWPKRK